MKHLLSRFSGKGPEGLPGFDGPKERVLKAVQAPEKKHHQMPEGLS
jgi:hypothetical protein